MPNFCLKTFTSFFKKFKVFKLKIFRKHAPILSIGSDAELLSERQVPVFGFVEHGVGVHVGDGPHPQGGKVSPCVQPPQVLLGEKLKIRKKIIPIY